MSLYPLFYFSTATSMNMVPSGSVGVFPIDMTTMHMVEIFLVQVSFTEDYALRAWVSLYPNGQSVITPYPNTFAVSRLLPRPLVMFLPNQTPPAGAVLAPVTAAMYYLNIQNMTNTQTAFSITQTILS